MTAIRVRATCLWLLALALAASGCRQGRQSVAPPAAAGDTATVTLIVDGMI